MTEGNSLALRLCAALVLLAALRSLLVLARPPLPDRSLPASGWPTVLPDLAHASWRELACLPGIGPARARTIVQTRARLGVPLRPELLGLLPGIGAGTAQRVAHWYARHAPPVPAGSAAPHAPTAPAARAAPARLGPRSDPPPG